MSLIKNFFRKKIVNKYNALSLSELRNLKITEKELLSLPLHKDKLINKTLQSLFYNFLIMPHFSKFYIFFYSIGLPIIFPLPFKHAIFLKKQNINCSVFLSFLLFYPYILYISLKKNFSSIFHILNLKQIEFDKRSTNIFFPKVSEKFLIPSNQHDNQDYSFILSSIKCLGITPNNIFHNNKSLEKFKIDNVKYEFGYPINALNMKMKFFLLINFLYKFLISLLYFVINKWQKLYLLDQENYIHAYKLSTIKNDAKINHVIFTFHDQLLRPFWSYLAQNHNFKFHLINHASGYYGFKSKDGFYPTDTMYHHLNLWDNYYVDSKIFYEHIKKIIPTVIFLEDKVSPFHSEQGISIDSKMKNICIFDVVPHHIFSRALMLPEDRYRISSICIKFLDDIINYFKDKDFQILLKSKHSLNSRNYPMDYYNYIKKLNLNKITLLNPRYSPKLLAKKSLFSISAPFTTAGFFETKTNYNFFYDPEIMIDKDDRARQNLKLINGKDELNLHLNNILTTLKK